MRNNADKVALIDAGDAANSIAPTRHTYREAAGRIHALATFLQSKGLGTQGRVGVLLHNSHHVVEAHYAAAGLRAILLNLNTRYRHLSLIHI